MVFIDLSWFGVSKNRFQIDANMHYKKKAEKTLKKSILAFILASQNLPKSLRNPLKSFLKMTLNEACFATPCKLPASRWKLTGAMVCKASKWLGIWLGLLHPSIHPSIHSPICTCPHLSISFASVLASFLTCKSQLSHLSYLSVSQSYLILFYLVWSYLISS